MATRARKHRWSTLRPTTGNVFPRRNTIVRRFDLAIDDRASKSILPSNRNNRVVEISEHVRRGALVVLE